MESLSWNKWEQREKKKTFREKQTNKIKHGLWQKKKKAGELDVK